MIFTIAIVVLVISTSIWKPEVGLAIALQSYLIRSAPNLPAYLINNSGASVDNNQIISIIVPLVVFVIIILKSIKKGDKFNINYLDTILMLLAIVILYGVSYSPVVSDGIGRAGRLFFIGISYYYVARLYFSKHKNHVQAVNNFFATTWVLSIVLGSYAYIQSYGIDYFRLTIGNAHPIPFSLLIASGVLINIFWLFGNGKTKKQKLILVLPLFILFVVFISTNTRGTILSLFVSLIFIIFALIVQKKVKLKYILLSSIVIVGCVLLVSKILPDTYTKVINNIELITSDDQGSSINERNVAHAEAIQIFRDNYIIGVGTGGFQYYGSLDYPHNIFLEILSENGLIGGIIFIIMSLIILVVLIRTMFKYSDIRLLIASMVLMNFVEMQFSFTFWMHKLFFVFCGIMIATYKKENIINNKKQRIKQNSSPNSIILEFEK